MPASFAIVNFLQSNEIELVPVKWLKKGECFWPPCRSIDVPKLVKALTDPEESWTLHEAKVIQLYDTFEEARVHVRKAEDTSEVNTDIEELGRGKRHSHKRKRTPSLSSNDEFSQRDQNYEASTGIHIPSISQFIADDNLNGAGAQATISASVEVENVNTLPRQEYSVIAESVQGDEFMSVSKSAYKKLLKELCCIRGTLREHGKLLQELLSRKPLQSTSEGSEEHNLHQEVEISVEFPIKTIEEIMYVESLLKERLYEEKIVSIISQGGGNSLENATRRILKRTMTDLVAMEFSWLGAKSKRSLSALQLSKAIFAAVRKYYSDATDCQIENIVKNWLRHAKARSVKFQ